jgi:hypothetical protein
MFKALSVALVGLWSSGGAEACERTLLYDNRANGQILELIDGSIWKVIDVGIADTRIWLTSEEIEVCDDGTLLNVDKDEQVKAKRIK